MRMRNRIEDPYKGWKLMTIILAAGVLLLSLTAIFAPENVSISLTALLLGTAMCAASGILALAKERKVVGYSCSVLAGIFLVLFLIGIVRLIW